MRVLLIGSGGREHAMAWKLVQSPKITKLIIAPGNAGTAELGENVAVKVDDLDGLISIAKTRSIDLTIVGPEQPLIDGIAELFQ
ncbi:MAG: phosphoribosylamine--glycine ligase, partial [Chloroflexi bacterium]|nr:phosphoribosylamine--glycine ligase [Chloroflexota bacterium]